MAGEIVLKFEVSPHQSAGTKPCVRNQVAVANGIYRPTGWLLRSGETCRVNVDLAYIPAEIKSSTPAAKILVDWMINTSDVTNAIKLYVKLYAAIPDNASYTLDPNGAAFTAALDSSVTDTSLGLAVPNRCSINIPDAMAVAGRHFVGTIERNDGDAGDPFAGDVWINQVLFQADKQ